MNFMMCVRPDIVFKFPISRKRICDMIYHTVNVVASFQNLEKY